MKSKSVPTYTLKKVCTRAKRHVQPKEFSATVVAVSTGESNVTLCLTLHDPRTETQEGYALRLHFNAVDPADALMATFCARLVAAMPETNRQVFERALTEHTK